MSEQQSEIAIAIADVKRLETWTPEIGDYLFESIERCLIYNPSLTRWLLNSNGVPRLTVREAGDNQ